MLYLAWAQDENNTRFLGTYEGNQHDIESYIKETNNVGYGLTLTLAKPIKVPEGVAARIKKLKDQQKQLETELETIKKNIKECGNPQNT